MFHTTHQYSIPMSILHTNNFSWPKYRKLLLQVRFKGHTHWTQLEPNGELKIPALYVPGWYLEAIEASTAALVYEGLQNFRNLVHLKVAVDFVTVIYCLSISTWTCPTASTWMSGAWTGSQGSTRTPWSISTYQGAGVLTGMGWSVFGG